MFVHNIDPVLSSIGPLEIRYYSLAYILGFLLTYWVLAKAADAGKVKGFTRKLADDLIAWSIVGTIVGGRLGYVLFYDPSFFLKNPLEVFMVWHGGMSFHGGLLGVILVGYWFVKKHNLSFYRLADLAVLPIAIGLGLGRIANFVNAELVGTVTDVSWCVRFKDNYCRHPVQLYLALKNFALAGIIYFLSQKKRKDGYLFWSFVVYYAAGRFILEFWRVGTVYIFGLSTEQWLTLVMALIGIRYLLKN